MGTVAGNARPAIAADQHNREDVQSVTFGLGKASGFVAERLLSCCSENR